MSVVTLLFLRRKDEILLAMKKRGFGEGKFNGVGGKVDSGETTEEAAKRECFEEIEVEPERIELAGRLHFYMDDDKDFYHDARIYVCYNWKNEPRETEEMRPKWFKESDIPYKSMWADDYLWLPLLLKGQKFIGKFLLGKDSVVDYELRLVDKLYDRGITEAEYAKTTL